MERLPENQIGWGMRLILSTGMRTQELLALEPRRIAEDGSTITIEQVVLMVKGAAAAGPPKSLDSCRTVPVSSGIQYCAMLLRDTDKKYIWETDNVGMVNDAVITFFGACIILVLCYTDEKGKKFSLWFYRKCLNADDFCRCRNLSVFFFIRR